MRSAIDLDRFKLAHEEGGVEHGSTYATAISELRAGQKRSHWIWYVFPQAVENLGIQMRHVRNTVKFRKDLEGAQVHSRFDLDIPYVKCI